RDDGRVVQKEWPFLVIADEPHRLIGDHVHAILGAGEANVAPLVVGIGAGGQLLVAGLIPIFQRKALIVVPQIRWIVAVSNSLAVVAEPAIDSLSRRPPVTIGRAQAPLAKAARHIAGLL